MEVRLFIIYFFKKVRKNERSGKAFLIMAKVRNLVLIFYQKVSKRVGLLLEVRF